MATGVRSASLTVTSDASNSPPNISITGVGQPSSMVLSLDKVAIDFGLASLSTLSTSTIRLVNQGNAHVTFGAPVINGTNAAGFSITNNGCGLAAAGDDCIISLAFAPSAVGERQATLTINSDAAGSPQIVPLYGTGQSIGHLLTASTNAVSMGAQAASTLSAATAVQISDIGTSPVTLTA